MEGLEKGFGLPFRIHWEHEPKVPGAATPSLRSGDSGERRALKLEAQAVNTREWRHSAEFSTGSPLRKENLVALGVWKTRSDAVNCLLTPPAACFHDLPENICSPQRVAWF